MSSALHFPLAGAAAFAAALIGIQLGNSAIEAIDPHFFQGPAIHPRDRGVAIDPAELEARRLARQSVSYDSLYGWDEGYSALRLACVDCGGTDRAPLAIAADYYDPSVPYFGSREEVAAEEARLRREIEARYEARLAADAERHARFALVERYAHPRDEEPGRPDDLDPEPAGSEPGENQPALDRTAPEVPASRSRRRAVIATDDAQPTAGPGLSKRAPRQIVASAPAIGASERSDDPRPAHRRR